MINEIIFPETTNDWGKIDKIIVWEEELSKIGFRFQQPHCRQKGKDIKLCISKGITPFRLQKGENFCKRDIVHIIEV